MEAGTPPVVAVAYSGGRDSTALLHVTSRLARQAGGLRVLALHVHHGLQAAADEWLSHCQLQCEAWAAQGLPVSLDWAHLALDPQPGHSIEALARQGRYRALASLASKHGASLVLLAHHRRDQAETFLLQALRGAGVDGLSAMPRLAARNGITWARPWLAQPREAIEHYVAQHALTHIDDDSNADGRYGRNRLRLQVWPALTAAFAQAEVTLSAAAARAQDASACAADLACIDLAQVGEGDGLNVSALLTLVPARRRNVLRHWYEGRLGHPMPATLALRVADELTPDAPGTWPLPVRQGGALRSYRNRLEACPAMATHDGSTGSTGSDGAEASGFDAAGRWPLPRWGGTLVAEAVAARGLAREQLSRARLAPRQGGEQFQPGPGRPPRSLKKQYQAAGVPAWQRGGPLLYVDDQLAFAPGLGIDARAWAPPGVDQVGLRWVPDGG